jgi:integrase
VAHNDLLAIGVVQRLRQRSMRVPEDVNVVGFDDIFASSLCTPTLTTLGGAHAEVGQGLLTRNVAELVEAQRVVGTEMSTWSGEQVRAFLDHVDTDRLAGAWHLTMRGLRRGEVCGLRWSDIDFDAAKLTISRTRTAVGREVMEGDPKSRRSRRDLPLNPALVRALRATQRAQAAERLAFGPGYVDSGHVVADEAGQPLRPEVYGDRFARLAKAAGLPPMRLHDARHTSVTLMLDAGVPVHLVAAWHGHDAAMTLRVYGHAKPDAMVEAAAKVGGLFGS